jgi:tetratricopeptide (TPR) repeat protein
MSALALATSPLARLLLALVERGADGAVDIGVCTLVLRGGAVEGLYDTTDGGRVRVARAHWAERLAAGIRVEEELGRVPPFMPSGVAGDERGEATEPLLPLLLDALAHGAHEHGLPATDRATDLVEPLEGPGLTEALAWAPIDVESTRGATLGALVTNDTQARRITALARAGFIRIVTRPSGTAPAPPRRPSGLTLAARDEDARPSSRPSGAPSILPPPRPASLVLAPGGGPAPSRVEGLATPLRDFPAAPSPLEDPIAPVEREVARLEQRGAPGPLRAMAWREAARQWQDRYGAIEESARCLREAAAANPSDRDALLQAAVSCASLGAPDLALAYGNACLALLDAGPAREEMRFRVALWAERAGQHTVALEALREAARSGHAPLGALERLFQTLVGSGARAEAVAVVREHAPLFATTEPVRARTLVADALALHPDDPMLARQLAAALAGEGLTDAAALVLAETARAEARVDVARQLRLEAAEQVEESGRPDIAAEFLLEALDAEPFLDAVREAVALDLERAGAPRELAIVCEQLARDAEEPEVEAHWWLRAATAHGAASDGWESALDALVRAATCSPDAPAVHAALEAWGAAPRDRERYADALERVAVAAVERNATTVTTWLRRLLARDEGDPGTALRQRWALAQLMTREADDTNARARREALHAAARDADARLADAELAYASSPRQDRPHHARIAGFVLARAPERRVLAMSRLREAASATPEDDGVLAALERLARLEGDDDALSDVLTARAAAAREDASRARHLLRLAAVASARGASDTCAQACLRLLAVDPNHPEALARLERAAARLGDADLAERACRERAAHATAPRVRARALVSTARWLVARGQLSEAVRFAEQALGHDRHSAAAAAMLVGLATALPPARAVALLDASRALLGDSPALLDALHRAARETGDTAAAGAVLDAWVRITPTSARPALARLAHRVAHDDARAIVSAATNALAPEALVEETPEAILAAIARLETLGARTEAVTLGLHALDALGAGCAPLRERVVELAARCDRPSLHVAALERSVGAARHDARLAPLRTLAVLHRHRGDDAAESRALLRLLAVSLYDADALSRLEAIYADHGEGERLLAVLGLRLESAGDDDRRRSLLLDLVAAAARAAGDLPRAARFVDQLVQAARGDVDTTCLAVGALVTLGDAPGAVARLLDAAEGAAPRTAASLCLRAAVIAEQEAGDPRLALDAAMRGLSLHPANGTLLLAFERLAIGLREVARGRSTYRTLADRAMGPHGRRAVLYRSARFLERCDEPEAALGAFVEAFDHSPAGGAVFRAIERLAASSGRYEPLVHALVVLAERSRHVDGRVALCIRAAELVENRLDDVERAFAILVSAWSASNARDDEARARATLTRLSARDPAAARRVGDDWLAAMRRRVGGAWDAGERAVWLARAALVEAESLGAPAEASALLEEAARADAESDPDPESRVPYLCDRAEALRALPNRLEEAIACVESAASVDLTNGRVRALAARLALVLPDPSSDTPRPADEAHDETPDGATPATPEDLPTAPGEDDARPTLAGPEPSFAPSASEEATATPDDTPSRPPEAATPHPDAEASATSGAAVATTARGEAPTAPTAAIQVYESAHRLRAELREHPAQIDALRALHANARERGARPETLVTAWLLSLFDPSVNAPPPLALEGRLDPEEQDVTRPDPAHAARAAVLDVVWEHAAQRTFRRSLQSYGTLGTDRVSPRTSPALGRAFESASRTLARHHVPLFQRQDGGAELVLATVTPPAIVIGPAFDGEEGELRFRFGQALALTRPAHLTTSALEPPQTRLLLDAVLAAFGPPEASHGASREAATLAAEMWRVMPPVHQRAVRDALAALPEPLDEASLRAGTFHAAARAGLLAAGDLRIAALTLCSTDPALAAHSLGSEAGYRAALAASAALTSLIRYALSDAFLFVVARATG